MKNKVKILLIIVVVALITTFCIVIGKTNGSHKGSKNEIAEDIGYSDETRKYLSSLDLNCNLETNDTYVRSFDLEPKKKQQFSIKKNTLNHSVTISILDDKGILIFEKKVSTDFCGKELLKNPLKSGKYQLRITFPKETKGTLEMKWNE